MAQKIRYRSLDVQQVPVESVLSEMSAENRVIVGIDVAKRNFVAALCSEAGETRLRVRFEHPRQTRDFLTLLTAVQQAGRTVEVGMEPTGTYGDELRYQ